MQLEQVGTPTVKVSAKEFSSKYNSKYEIYRFLRPKAIVPLHMTSLGLVLVKIQQILD